MPRRNREPQSLTDPFIMVLKPDLDKAYEVFDARVGGFSVQVYPSGKKTYFVNYNLGGKRKRIRIGEPKLMKISEARTLAMQEKEKVKSGIDPKLEREQEVKAQTRRHEISFANIADIFIQRYCIEDKNLKSTSEYKRQLDKYVIPQWGHRNIEDIKRLEVTALLDDISDNHGPYQANRVLATIRKLFNWACMRGTIAFVPIVAGMARTETPRERVLTDEEIVKFWDGCEKIKYPFGKLFQLLLITGQRRSEVANMKWSQINMTDKVWTLPPHSTKMKRAHLVPLNKMAIDILEMLPKYANRDLLFPTAWDNDRPVSNFEQAKKRVCELEKHWQLNDVRRTVRTNLSVLKIQPHISERVQGRVDNTVQRHYDIHDYVDEKRDALEKWSDRLTSILGKNIVVLDNKRPQ